MALTLGLCLALAAWVLHPALSAPVEGAPLIGDPSTDAVRGMWGFDHLRRSLLPPDTPLWSGELNFPHGVLALVLPVVSGVLLAPLGLLLGPVWGYNAGLLLLLAGAGFGAAALVRALTRSWVAGAALAGPLMSSPMLLHAICDGTPEHVSIWLLPLFLAAAARLAERPNARRGAIAGALAVAVAIDSPYHGVFGAVIGGIALPTLLLRPWPKGGAADAARGFGAAALVLTIGGLALGLIYRNFPIDEQMGLQNDQLLKMNAVDLHTWWQYDLGPRPEREQSLAPTAIPAVLLWGGLGLAVLGLPRSLPWAAAGVLALMLSFGLNDRIPAELARWLGAEGQSLGRLILRWNAALYELPGISKIRFPWRWLVPATLAFTAGAGFGVARLVELLRRVPGVRRAALVLLPALAAALSLGAVRAGVHTARFHAPFPVQGLPAVAFAEWVRDYPASGAFVLLPQLRPAPKSGKRGDLPVFASIAASLSSADSQYLQVRMGRSLIGYPSLKTLVPMKVDLDIYRLIRNWDDLSHPLVTGKPIPTSSYDERSEPARQRVIEGLRADGLRFVIVDEAAYGPEGLQILRAQLAAHTAEERRFDEGTGVTVFALKP